MKVKCFGCEAVIEARDSDAVVHAFVAHGKAKHTWEYPGKAIRNYARNYAEATARLTGGTERLPEIAGGCQTASDPDRQARCRRADRRTEAICL